MIQAAVRVLNINLIVMTLTWIHLAIEIVHASVIIAKNVFDYLKTKARKNRGIVSAKSKTRAGRKERQSVRNNKRLKGRGSGADDMHRVKAALKSRRTVH